MENQLKGTSCEEISSRISRQRHDFLNHLQVVYGYIQINKPEKALCYLDDLTANMKREAELAPQYDCPEKICK